MPVDREDTGHAPAEFGDWRRRLHAIIFEADTRTGKLFDVALLVAILLSVLCVILESVAEMDRHYRRAFVVAEWVFTLLFTVEYVLRLLCVRKPRRYALSFLGIVDLMAVIPTYISLLWPGSQSLLVVRALRLLRVFRIFKLRRFLAEAEALKSALLASRTKIIVFLSAVVVNVVIMGAAMYLVEGAGSGFTSIPQSMYWAIVTMTTVGYGDIAPATPLGKVLAAGIMIMGYAMIVVPTGIISAEMAQSHARVTTKACPDCSLDGHDPNAKHCKFCGGLL